MSQNCLKLNEEKTEFMMFSVQIFYKTLMLHHVPNAMKTLTLLILFIISVLSWLMLMFPSS